MSNRSITITGLLLGAASTAAGFWLARSWILPRLRQPITGTPAKAYSQGDVVARSIGRLIAKRKAN
jgi:hypothetical protein